MASSAGNYRDPDSERIEVADIIQDHYSQTPKNTGQAPIGDAVFPPSQFVPSNEPSPSENQEGNGNGGGNEGGIGGAAPPPGNPDDSSDDCEPEPDWQDPRARKLYFKNKLKVELVKVLISSYTSGTPLERIPLEKSTVPKWFKGNPEDWKRFLQQIQDIFV